jgi:hypothetical protein
VQVCRHLEPDTLLDGVQRMQEAERRDRLQQQEADRARRRKDADIRCLTRTSLQGVYNRLNPLLLLMHVFRSNL